MLSNIKQNKQAKGNLHPAVYIPSLEGSDIYLHNYHEQPLFIRYAGMIPQSLELESLVKHGLKIIPGSKRTTNDIINISFKTRVNPVSDKIKKLNVKVSDITRKLDKYNDMLPSASGEKEKDRINFKILGQTKSLEKIKKAIVKLESTYWGEIGIEGLRHAIYNNEEFFIKYQDKDGNLIDKINYVISSRSSAKSRIGKVLAIRKELYEDMKEWRRLGLSLDGRNGDDVDFVAALAYESLTGSSIINTLEINPDNILIIEDYEDKFSAPANLVSVDEETKLLVNNKGIGDFCNVIWDGQALLDEEYYADTDKSMKLLRQHWFKAAAFRCNISEFMKMKAKELNKDYDTWELKGAYNTKILAKNVCMITTPSALKFMKISNIVGSKEKMYAHWISKVREEGNLFGVVKTEKPTKLGYEDGQPIQQLSYQYLNSMPISKENLLKLAEYELRYIEKLKNDEEAFYDYIVSKSDMTNGNEMMANLYKHNSDIVHTQMWRNWKSDTIGNYIKRVRSGKMKVVNSDYMVLLSNPIEMLYASIGYFKGECISLSGKEVYCRAFEWDKELIGMRSPHTGPGNILYAINKDDELINKYFPDISKNIVIINNIGATTFERLNGADADSDTMFMSDNPILASVAKDCDEKYLVCKAVNIGTQKNPYTVCNKDMANIDNKLNNDYIGRVTNIAALLCSHIWNANEKGENINDMLDKLAVLSITQGLVIDYAKRIPSVSINQILSDANKLLSELLGDKKEIPIWWAERNKDVIKQYVKSGANKVAYECPMDYICDIFKKLPNAGRKSNKDLNQFIHKQKAGKANNKQRHIINDILDRANNKLNKSHIGKPDDEQKRELYVDRLDSIKLANDMLTRVKTLNADTMYSIIKNIVDNKVDNNTIQSFNLLYQAKKTLFINAFIKK